MRYPLPSAVLLALSVAGCVAPPADAPPAPPPPRAATPPPPVPAPAPLSGDWRDWPLTPGTWRYQRDARGTHAAFGAGGGEPRLVLRCEASGRRIFLSRPGRASGALTVRTTSTTRALPVRAAGGGASDVVVELPSRDPLLDAMAFSRGRFVIEQAGAPTLVVPAYAEIGRVIEDCRG